MSLDGGKVLEVVFGGLKALLRGAEFGVSRLLRVVLSELDRSEIGRVIVDILRPSKDAVKQAQDIADEEAELAQKAETDRKQSENDRERQEELERSRQKLRKEYEEAKARETAEELRKNGDKLVSAAADSDEYAANIGLGTLKKIAQSAVRQ